MNPTTPRSWSRRAVLGGLGALGAFVGTRPDLALRPAYAADLPDDRYFLFCYFNGGWDLLLTLDPRDPVAFSPDLKKVTRIETGFEYLPTSRRTLVSTAVPSMTFGPYVGRIAEKASQLCVVRGMSMDTLTHEVGRRRYLTGIPPAGLQAQGSSIATVLASALGANEPIPQISVRVESYNDRFDAYASAIKVNGVDDLVRGLQRSPHELGELEQRALDDLLAAFRAGQRTQASRPLTDAHTFRLGAADLVALGLADRFDFAAETAEMEAIRALYAFAADDLASPGAQAAAAVTALTSGISRCASIVVAADLDHHGPDWAEAHGPRLESGFDLIASIMDDLASREFRSSGESWLDHTTILAFSEFGRTALLNPSGGRDHHLVNCALLAGAGVRGGQVIGRSSDVGMAPTAIDFESGAVDPAGAIPKPENLFRALLASVGIDDDIADLRAEALTAIRS